MIDIALIKSINARGCPSVDDNDDVKYEFDITPISIEPENERETRVPKMSENPNPSDDKPIGDAAAKPTPRPTLLTIKPCMPNGFTQP